MKIRFTPEALAELQDILAYVEEQSPQGAGKLSQRIEAVLDHLATYPHAGPLTSLLPMRRIAVSPFPYLIFYIPEEEAIEVVGVRHASRDPATMPDWL